MFASSILAIFGNFGDFGNFFQLDSKALSLHQPKGIPEPKITTTNQPKPLQ